uniref:Uncharacterized protein n=1 Tax=Lotharella oceanica TaxID=641309 RepID=A0A7S2U3G0_9EUKA
MRFCFVQWGTTVSSGEAKDVGGKMRWMQLAIFASSVYGYDFGLHVETMPEPLEAHYAVMNTIPYRKFEYYTRKRVFSESGASGRLLEAAERGNLAEVKHLLDDGANVEVRDDTGRSPLILAAGASHVDVVEYLVGHSKADLEAKQQDGRTALMLAVLSGNLEVVRYLIEHKANVEAADDDGLTALMLAAHWRHRDIVKHLVEHAKANVEVEDKNGNTALCWAAYRGYTEVVQYLVENTKAKIKHGTSALVEAIRAGHLDVVHYLVENAEANADVEDTVVKATRNWARRNGRENIDSYLKAHLRRRPSTRIKPARSVDTLLSLRPLVVRAARKYSSLMNRHR